ncbi:cytochrome c [Sulfitobacter sp. F26204]|uniref:c-type cytochrome n=1 Tax=Sulfitobacter sp. F26204 TaxID=2996014 RepID=UPI00225E2FAB|nr:cytochrome c [Sulfitobacter sp. F26204]MCX7561820.1 cytochrome c [Sulfitobacter sp. F26204]
MRKSSLTILSAIVGSVAVLAYADGHISDKQIAVGIKARQSQMQLYAFNLGALGAMAKGEVPYDAEAASGAANNLAALASLSQAGYWLPGSDSDSVEGSRALPAIWSADSKVGEKGKAFYDAVIAMQSAAGTDLGALQAAMGAVGKSCGGCHEDYRKPKG